MFSDSDLAPKVEELANEIAGERGSLELARDIAAAQIELDRIRQVRYILLASVQTQPLQPVDATAAPRAQRLRKLLRRQERPGPRDWIDTLDAWVAKTRPTFNFPALDEARAARALLQDATARDAEALCAEIDYLDAIARTEEMEPEREARVLGELSAKLEKLERYERRVRSRRKAAIRRYDLADVASGPAV